MSSDMSQDERWMRRALELAERGRGCVEPNPMVGCVVVRDGSNVGEGFHERYGQAHAEVNALRRAGDSAEGATVYVTLEPCCHYGKTPPCAAALIRAGVRRVVAAMRDPFPKVAGGGFEMLEKAGITVESGLLEREAQALNAPYLKLVCAARPFVTATWAMTLDGRIATKDRSSRWISGEEARAEAHKLRARMDAVLVGVGTVLADDPQLTARGNFDFPARTPLRVVADARLETPLESRLVRTARDVPVLILVGPDVSPEKKAPFEAAGCEIFTSPNENHTLQLRDLLDELGRRRLTNLLVEGGASVLGNLFDLREVDDLWLVVSPKICGGARACSPVGGAGISRMETVQSLTLTSRPTRDGSGDILLSGRMVYPPNEGDLFEERGKC